MTDERTVEQDRPQRPDFITGVMGRYYWKAIADAYMDAQDAEIARLREELAKEDRIVEAARTVMQSWTARLDVIANWPGQMRCLDVAIEFGDQVFDTVAWSEPLPSPPAPEKEKP